ncbi:MAG: hypothetical protein GY725_23610 [bacterium]|nr:hypothetical protein [bacterium]
MAMSSLGKKHALVFAVALVCAISYGKAALASLALGGGIQIVNLRALEKGVVGMLGLAASGHSAAMMFLLHMRWLLVMGSVGALLLLYPVEPIAFVVGLSTVVPAVIWHGLSTARALTDSNPES